MNVKSNVNSVLNEPLLPQWSVNKEQNDFRLQVGGYLLRVEQMEGKVWWWCIYNEHNEQVLSSYTKGEWCDNIDEAKRKAEQGYLSLVETKV